MFGIFFLVSVLASVSGRVPWPKPNLPDVLKNIVDSDFTKFKNTINHVSTRESTTTQSNTDQKVDFYNTLHNDMNEIAKDHTTQATIDDAERNVSESSIFAQTTNNVPANIRINITEVPNTIEQTSALLTMESEENNNTRYIDNMTLTATNEKKDNASKIILQEFNHTIQDSTNEIVEENVPEKANMSIVNVTSTVLTEKNSTQNGIKPENINVESINMPNEPNEPQPNENDILPASETSQNKTTVIYMTEELPTHINESTKPILNTTTNNKTTKALILTSYIQNGFMELARNASEVNSTLFLGFKSYSGFLTVNKTYNSNTFFWYFPVVGKPVEETPWIIWLQGGPGRSSLFALFEEFGPFSADNERVLHKNPFTWLESHSLVFIDNPIGTGFSFATDKKGYATNMETYSGHLYEATRQLLLLFPELQRAPLYVAGESYGGKYVPSLALELHTHRDEIQCNLQGIMLGNAFTDPYPVRSVEPWLYFGVLDADEALAIQPLIDVYNRQVAAGNYVEALQTWNFNITEFLLEHSYGTNIYNYLVEEGSTGVNIEGFLQQANVREAIHVGQRNFKLFNKQIYDTLASEPSDVRPKIETLLEHYKVLAYCGNLDQMFPCSTAAESHRSWRWSGAGDFVRAPRHKFVYHHTRTVSGYYKTGGHFTEAVFIGAGHKVTADRPAVAQIFITKWTHGKKLTKANTSTTSYKPSNSCVTTQVADNEIIDLPKVTNETKIQTAETMEQVTTESEINNQIVENNKNQVDRVSYESSENVSEITQPLSTKTLDKTLSASENQTELPTTTEFSFVDINNEHDTEPEGEPLILTHYLKEGLIEQGRNASEVNSTLFFGFKSYSGLFTVNETYNSNTFFWYFPVVGKPVEETPWIIWLQGGPGITSMLGLLDEVGPFSTLKNGTLTINPNSWLQNHSLVFIDNPVGTGFSFTEHKDGFAKDTETYSGHLYEATRQLLLLFPELQRAPLYVAGESYGGKYVPSLALELHTHRDEINVNLKGLLVGNGYIEPTLVANFSRSFYYLGLLSPEDLRDLQPQEECFDRAVRDKDVSKAKDIWIDILANIISRTHLRHAYNFIQNINLVENIMNCISYMNRRDVRQALHVGALRNYVYNDTVAVQLKPEFLTSVKYKYEVLMEHYRVLLYCGQLDQMMSCGIATKFHRTFQWSGLGAFVEAKKLGFTFNNHLVGYHKTGGNLTEALIRGAGHMAPADQARPVQDLVTRWIHQLEPFGTTQR